MIKKSLAWVERQNIVVVILLVVLIRVFGFGLYQVPTGSMETTMLVGERFFADKFTVWFTSIKRGEIIAFNDPTYKYSDNKIVNVWQRYVWGPINWTKRVIGIPGDHVQGKIEGGHPVVYVNGKKLDEPYVNKYPLITGFKTIPHEKFVFLPHTELKDQPFMNSDITLEEIQKTVGSITRFSYDPTKLWPEQPFYATAISEKQLIKALPILQPGVPSEEVSDIFDVVLGENQYWVMGDNRLGSYDSRGQGVGPIDGSLIHGRIKLCIFSLDSLNGWFTTDLIQHPIEFFTKMMRWSRCMRFVS